jgi:outer membrane protein OmpA-like peptidoglycan-associated protein
MTKIKKSLILATAGLVTLSACTDPAQYPGGNDPQKKTKQGAVVGGFIGAITGLATAGDDPGKSAAVGAIVGAGAGALIGAQLDKQEADLRNSLGDDVLIRNTGSELIVTMPQDILFATDSDRLTGTLRSDLASLARSLQRYPDTTVDVIGHTDNTGAASYNQNLSARRAAAVANVLRANGVASSRIRAFGRGESDPIASNYTVDGRAQNRRVEIVIRPNA